MEHDRSDDGTNRLNGSKDVPTVPKQVEPEAYAYLIIAMMTLMSTSLSFVENLQFFIKNPDNLESQLLSTSHVSQIICLCLCPAFLIRKYAKITVSISMGMLAVYVIVNIYFQYFQEKDYHFSRAGILVGPFSALLVVTACSLLTFIAFENTHWEENRLYKYLAIYFSLNQVSNIVGALGTTLIHKLYQEKISDAYEYDHRNDTSSRFTGDSVGVKTNISNNILLFVSLFWAIGSIGVWIRCYDNPKTNNNIVIKPTDLFMFRQYFHIHSLTRMCSSFCLGLQQAYFVSVFKLMHKSAHPESSSQSSNLDTLLLSFYIASLLGCCLAYPANRFCKRRIIFLGAFLGNFVIVSTVLAVYFFEPKFQLPQISFYAMSCLWGLSDGILQVQTAGYYGTKFDGIVEIAFARHYLGIALGQLIGHMTLGIRVQLVLMIFFLLAVLRFSQNGSLRYVSPSNNSTGETNDDFNNSPGSSRCNISFNSISLTEGLVKESPRCLRNQSSDF